MWEGVQRVLREGQYANYYFPSLNTAYGYSLATMNFANGLVSAPLYGYLYMIGQPIGADPEEIISKQAGICQQAQIVFLAIAEKIGLPARAVGVFYPEEFPEYTGPGIPGHATVEVFYGDTWHWFDPTWGIFYRKPGERLDNVLSLYEVMQLSKEDRQAYEVSYKSLLWRQVVESSNLYKRGTGFSFLDFQHLRVESPYGNFLYGR